MRIRGRVILFNDLDKEAEIELPSVDISKIKEGDEVWVKLGISNKENDVFFCNSHTIKIWQDDIIAHFPKEEREPKPEKIEVPEKFLQLHLLSYTDAGQIAFIMTKINQLIDCLAQIRERMG